MEHRSVGACPLARFDGLTITETADDVLVYDMENHHIHQLNQSVAAVWRLCDGQRTVSELSRQAAAALGAEMDVAIVQLALRKLETAGLLAHPLPAEARGAGESRRALLRRAAVAGAVAVPAIVSISSPTAAHGHSTTTPCRSHWSRCDRDKDCCSGNCRGGVCKP